MLLKTKLHKNPLPSTDAAEKRNNPDTFTISKKVLHEIIKHCKFELPYEACGLVSGTNGVAKTIWKMKNLAHSTLAFSMDMEEIRSVFQLIEKRNESFLGIYHSHPTDWAFPSPEDIALNNYPEVEHLIVSFARKNPEVKCFHMNESNVEQLFIHVIDLE